MLTQQQLTREADALFDDKTSPGVPGKVQKAIARIYIRYPEASTVLTATLISKNVVLTCAHGLRNRRTDDIVVSFPVQQRFRGRVIGIHPTLDLALVHVLGNPQADPIRLARAASIDREPVTAYGYGGTGTLVGGRAEAYRLIHLTRPARKGDSGGPVFNDRWELCGVIYASNLSSSAVGTDVGAINQFVRTQLRTRHRAVPPTQAVSQSPATRAPVQAARQPLRQAEPLPQSFAGVRQRSPAPANTVAVAKDCQREQPVTPPVTPPIDDPPLVDDPPIVDPPIVIEDPPIVDPPVVVNGCNCEDGPACKCDGEGACECDQQAITSTLVDINSQLTTLSNQVQQTTNIINEQTQIDIDALAIRLAEECKPDVPPPSTSPSVAYYEIVPVTPTDE